MRNGVCTRGDGEYYVLKHVVGGAQDALSIFKFVRNVGKLVGTYVTRSELPNKLERFKECLFFSCFLFSCFLFRSFSFFVLFSLFVISFVVFVILSVLRLFVCYFLLFYSLFYIFSYMFLYIFIHVCIFFYIFPIYSYSFAIIPIMATSD